MSWMAYCWRESFECERLARVEQGEARAEWLAASQHWLDQSAEAAKTAPEPAPPLVRRRIAA